MLSLCESQKLPLVLLAEGGGGRPGDVDVDCTRLPTQRQATALLRASMVPRVRCHAVVQTS